MGQSCINVEKLYFDKLDAQNPLDLSLLSTSSEFLIGKFKLESFEKKLSYCMESRF